MRIRTIKPELLSDEKVAALSSTAFRLFIGIILLADDHGRGPGDVRWLRAQVFWGGDVSTEETALALAELTKANIVQHYMVSVQYFFAITNWHKHQKVDKPSRQRFPGPPNECADGESSGCEDSSRDPRETLANPREELDDPRETLGNDRRTVGPRTVGREAGLATDQLALTPNAPPAQKPRGRRRSTESPSVDYQANRAAIDRLMALEEDLRLAAVPGTRRRPATTQRANLIAQRFADGATEADCEHVLRVYAAEARRLKPGERIWFDGISNWVAGSFARALGQPLQATNGAPHRDEAARHAEQLRKNQAALAEFSAPQESAI